MPGVDPKQLVVSEGFDEWIGDKFLVIKEIQDIVSIIK